MNITINKIFLYKIRNKTWNLIPVLEKTWSVTMFETQIKKTKYFLLWKMKRVLSSTTKLTKTRIRLNTRHQSIQWESRYSKHLILPYRETLSKTDHIEITFFAEHSGSISGMLRNNISRGISVVLHEKDVSLN